MILIEMILRGLEELDHVPVNRPDGRRVERAGQSRAGPQLGLAGQPVQEVEGRNSGGRHQALELRELLDDRLVLFEEVC